MNPTNTEKLILMMLTEIYEHLNIKDGVDAKVVRAAIKKDQTWALPLKYPALFRGEQVPLLVTKVLDILSMWDLMEASYERLTAEDKTLVAKESGHGDRVRFTGFDGTSEGECCDIAQCLIEDLDRFPRFKGRDLQAQFPLSHRRMVNAFAMIRNSLSNRTLNVGEMIAILREGR